MMIIASMLLVNPEIATFPKFFLSFVRKNPAMTAKKVISENRRIPPPPIFVPTISPITIRIIGIHGPILPR